MTTSDRTDLLNGVCAKLGRANQHLHVFDTTHEAWAMSHPYGVKREFHPDSGWVSYTWKLLKPVPDQFSVILGDYLNNLRGALDHIIAAMLRRFGQPIDRGHSFPIAIEEKQWSDAPKWPQLVGIPSKWRAVIKTLQPYYGGNDPKQHPLAILNNADKHRTIHPLASSAMEFEVSGQIPDGHAIVDQWWLPPLSRLEDGTTLYAVRTEPPTNLRDVHVNPDMTIQIAFEHAELGGAFGDLPQLFDAVQLVIARLAPAFD